MEPRKRAKVHTSRLRKVLHHLDKSLDSLHRSNGELYPAELLPYRESIQRTIRDLEQLRATIADDQSPA